MMVVCVDVIVMVVRVDVIVMVVCCRCDSDGGVLWM